MNMSVSFNTLKFVWIPRVLIIAFTAFISLFSFDAFSGNDPILDKLAGFLIHMLPSLVMILFLVLTWKRPAAAGVIFILLGVVFTFFFNTYEQAASFFTISLIPVLTGLMFLVPAMIRRKTSSSS